MAAVSVSFCFLVLLCICGVAARSPLRGPRHANLIVLEVDPQQAADDWDQQACQSFDFRGRFGDFGLLVGGRSDLARARQFAAARSEGTRILATHDGSKEVWVVECHAKYVGLVEEVRTAAVVKQLPILYQYQDVSGKTSLVIQGDIGSLSHLSASFISVPTTPQVPLRDYTAAYPALAAEPDEVISKLVEKISQTELRGNVEKLSSFFTRLSTSPTILQAQQWLEQQFAGLGLEVSTFPFRAGYSSNVIGDLKGAEDPSTIIVNPDLRAPGADDNGSGSSNVLEIARVLSQSDVKFKYTVRFCLWSGEEQGLYGSRAYASKMKQDGENIIAVLNGDMLGWTLPRTNITVGMSDRFISKPLNDLVNGITRTYVPSIGIGPTSACCSDHQSFFENGFPAVGYAENTGLYTDYPYYHRSNDLPEMLNFVQITLISQAITAAAATLAVPLA